MMLTLFHPRLQNSLDFALTPNIVLEKGTASWHRAGRSWEAARGTLTELTVLQNSLSRATAGRLAPAKASPQRLTILTVISLLSSFDSWTRFEGSTTARITYSDLMPTVQ